MGDNDVGRAIWDAPGKAASAIGEGWNEVTGTNAKNKANQLMEDANETAQAQLDANTAQAATEQAQRDKYNKAFDESMGANAGESLQKAESASSPIAQQQAMQTASNQLAVGRGAGLNKGQASLQAGQQVGNTYSGAKQQATGNYFNSANMFGGQANQAGNRALGYGTDWGGVNALSGNAQAQQAAALAQQQAFYQAIKDGTGAIASFIPKPGAAKDGTTDGEGLTEVGEEGSELAILAPGSIVIPHEESEEIKAQKTEADMHNAIKAAVARLKKAGK